MPLSEIKKTIKAKIEMYEQEIESAKKLMRGKKTSDPVVTYNSALVYAYQRTIISLNDLLLNDTFSDLS